MTSSINLSVYNNCLLPPPALLIIYNNYWEVEELKVIDLGGEEGGDIEVDGEDVEEEIVADGSYTSETCIQKLTVRHYDNNTCSNPSQKSKEGAMPENSAYEKTI